MVSPAGAARLLYRRQFILGPRPSSLGLGWPSLPVASRFVLEAHPDLPVLQVRDAHTELTLIGVMLDPANPHRTDRDVLDGLLSAASEDRGMHEELRRMGGRWALVIAGDGPPLIVHDLCGLRQVVHCAAPDGVWCASQPSLLARELSLVPDRAATAFASSIYVRSYREAWWPGTSTPYAGVQQLLPNHALDLASARVSRYWPRSPRRRLGFTQGTEQAAALLRGVVEAAANRFPLALALTAGVDSRAVMAAARSAVGDVYLYTMSNPRLGLAERDAEVAERVAERVGLPHHRIVCPTVMDECFGAVYRINTATPHEVWGAEALGLLREYPQDRVNMTGNCSEIARRGYRRIHPVDAAGLARLENMVANPYARDRIDEWLADAGPVPAWLDYLLVDLYYLENRMGRWLAQGLTEFDIAQETLAPFNCRALAETLLAIDPVDRDPPGSRAHRRIVELLWPELLAEPFNPVGPVHRALTGFKSGTGRLLRATHTYDRVKELQLRRRAGP